MNNSKTPASVALLAAGDSGSTYVCTKVVLGQGEKGGTDRDDGDDVLRIREASITTYNITIFSNGQQHRHGSHGA